MPRTKIIKQEDPERRQTGVKLDWELLREFKILALRRNTTLGDLLEVAMRDYLKRAEGEEGKK